MGEAARQDFNDTGVRVTLIEPGMVDTPFFDTPPEIEALQPEDIARAVMFAVPQPPHMDVNEILIRPTAQPELGQLDDDLHVVGLPLERLLPAVERHAPGDQPRAASRGRPRRAPSRPPRSGGGWR